MNNLSKRASPTLLNIFKFIEKGYTFREVVSRGWSMKLYSLLSNMWVPFAERGARLNIAFSTVIDGARYISIGNDVWLQRSVWLSVPLLDMKSPENRIYLQIEDGCQIGPHCTISAYNKIHIKKNVLLAPNIMIVDHAHAYEDVTLPILHQGLAQVGSVVIEENCWISTNVVIAASKDREIVIGRNSVVAANSVVRHSIPAYSVASGNPARVVKNYDFETKQWVAVK